MGPQSRSLESWLKTFSSEVSRYSKKHVPVVKEHCDLGVCVWVRAPALLLVIWVPLARLFDLHEP